MIGDEALARRLESFQARVNAEVADAVLHVGEGSAIFAGVGSPLTQAIACDRGVEHIEQFFFDRGADSTIQVTPWSPPAFIEELARRGYRIVEFENVLGLVIPSREDGEESGRRIKIERADDVSLWTRIAAESFASDEASVDFLTTVMTRFARAKHAHTYIATVDGEPAGSAAMFALRELKVAGFFAAGTLPRFRNRGVQTALLQRRVTDAAKLGCEIAMVTTQPGSASHRNVARRGFELLYTKLSMRLDKPR